MGNALLPQGRLQIAGNGGVWCVAHRSRKCYLPGLALAYLVPLETTARGCCGKGCRTDTPAIAALDHGLLAELFTKEGDQARIKYLMKCSSVKLRPVRANLRIATRLTGRTRSQEGPMPCLGDDLRSWFGRELATDRRNALARHARATQLRTPDL